MAKPCKYKDVETGGCSCEKHYRDKDGINHCIMEPYTTEKCNMKQPAKVKRIRAWAMIYNNAIFAGNSGPYEWRKIPATILISAKYLAKDKGGRK